MDAGRSRSFCTGKIAFRSPPFSWPSRNRGRFRPVSNVRCESHRAETLKSQVPFVYRLTHGTQPGYPPVILRSRYVKGKVSQKTSTDLIFECDICSCPVQDNRDGYAANLCIAAAMPIWQGALRSGVASVFSTTVAKA